MGTSLMAVKNAPRPDYIHIGIHTYQVDWLNPEEWEINRYPDDTEGATFASKQRIAIRLVQGRRESGYQETLIHEVQHALWDLTYLTHVPAAKFEDRNDGEEFIIGLTSAPLLGVLQHNPHLVAYFMSDGNTIR